MNRLFRPWLVIALVELAGGRVAGQVPTVVPAAPAGEAATVNGQPIPEVAVQRGLCNVAPDKRDQARGEVLTFLVNNLLIDQYLQKLPNLGVDKKAVDDQFDKLRAEIKKEGQDFAKVLKDLMVTEDELRSQLAADLRWEKFATSQVTDQGLREFFDKNTSLFDSAILRARHILLTPAAETAQANDQARAQLADIRKQIEDEVARGMAKLPEGADNLTREKERVRLLEAAFAAQAKAKSACPSKTEGGDIGNFPRANSLVEPFAKAAFELKTFQLSDVVTTQFGHHLILVTERKPGKEVKFEDNKDGIREMFFEKLRENLVAQLRQRATIAIKPAPKP